MNVIRSTELCPNKLRIITVFFTDIGHLTHDKHGSAQVLMTIIMLTNIRPSVDFTCNKTA